VTVGLTKYLLSCMSHQILAFFMVNHCSKISTFLRSPGDGSVSIVTLPSDLENYSCNITLGSIDVRSSSSIIPKHVNPSENLVELGPSNIVLIR